MNNEIRSGYYRVSVKALVLNELRDKFLIVREENGRWELPGGGLDWEESPHEGLAREIQEEMGLVPEHIAEYPSYFLTSLNWRGNLHIANVLYETTFVHLDFMPTTECVEIRFVNAEDLEKIEGVCPNVVVFAKLFDPTRHRKG